jgi:hypothetical protein
MPIVLAFLVLLSGGATLSAQNAPSPSPLIRQGSSYFDEPSAFIGIGLATAWENFGVPESVYSVRGDAAWQDDVVFQYGVGVSLFWFQGRVWQVRMNGAYAYPVRGLYLKDPQSKLAALFGQPLLTLENSYVYALPLRAYPLRLRAVVKDGVVTDIYLYRADF